MGKRMGEIQVTNNRILKLTLAAVCLALCMVLPFLTGQIPEIGSMLCPMHIPVLLCGFLCGPAWAAIVGAIAPLLRFALFGMPPLFPTGMAMAFELAAYGAVSGLLYRVLPRRAVNVYVALIGAMLAGRIVWGAVMLILSGVTGSAFTFAAFLAGAFTNAVPGMILHILLIPVIVLAVEKALPWLKK
ncbi:MAG: ECF transporter S component [Clostridia bacterium]|nr:ECF transporter S component [Clostridia bacterium]